MIEIVINPEYKYLEGFVENLPASFANEGETLYAARNIIKLFDVEGFKVNVKFFKKPILINQIVYRTFRKSKARRSYEYAFKLKEKGLYTPAPIAYIKETKFGLLKNSFYISKHESFDGTMRELKTSLLSEKEELIKQFAKYTASLHEQQILHLDYSSGNILYKKDGDNYIFYLVDLNRMEFDKPISMDTACFNFRRLWGSDDMIFLFIKEYAQSRNFDVEDCLKRTLYYRKRFWDNFTKKHPGSAPFATDYK